MSDVIVLCFLLFLTEFQQRDKNCELDNKLSLFSNSVRLSLSSHRVKRKKRRASKMLSLLLVLLQSSIE